jgi:hypothetical protein
MGIEDGRAVTARVRLRRWLYRGGRPNRLARALNWPSALLARWGLGGARMVTLEVRGRRSGRTIALPLVPVPLDGERYLVCMLGPDANWVRNIRAADGDAVLRHGRAERVRLVDVPVAQRPPIVARYLELAPGARPHLPVARGASLTEIAAVADRIPVFRITPSTT